VLFAEPAKGPYVFKPGGIPAKKSEYESNTSLLKFFECPVIYHDWYAKKFREPASKELVFGRAYHLTLENVLREKAISGLAMHPVAMSQRFEQWMLIEAHYGGDIDWKLDGPEQSFEAYLALGQTLVGMWREQYLPGLKPATKGKDILVEYGFWLPLEKCKRALMGKIDLITSDGLLVDHKTSSHVWKSITTSKFHKAHEYNGVQFFEEDLQLAIYIAAYEDKIKDWPKSCELHRAITSSSPEIERIVLDYSADEVQTMFDKVIKPAMREIDGMWSSTFPCRCGKHDKSVPATAARPLATAEGYAAGTTEGPVVATDSLLDKANRGARMVRDEPPARPASPPSVDWITGEEIPF
jgi:PD-(D/E)XK nuclease superfamily protein